jgi:hypothetical protein
MDLGGGGLYTMQIYGGREIVPSNPSYAMNKTGGGIIIVCLHRRELN